MALSEKGIPYSCGLNSHGRLGFKCDDEKQYVDKFRVINFFPENQIKVADINAGGRHCIAVGKYQTGKDHMYVWGSNHSFELALEGQEEFHEPERVDIVENKRRRIISIAAGYD